jgi:hypothetical protein
MQCLTMPEFVAGQPYSAWLVAPEMESDKYGAGGRLLVMERFVLHLRLRLRLHLHLHLHQL